MHVTLKLNDWGSKLLWFCKQRFDCKSLKSLIAIHFEASNRKSIRPAKAITQLDEIVAVYFHMINSP